MRTTATIAGCLLALALAGCSGAEPTAQPSPTPSGIPAVVSSLDCTYTATKQSELELFVAEGGTCTLPNGNTVLIRRFADADSLDQWRTVGGSMGVDPSMSAMAGLVMISPDVDADLVAVKGALAGTPMPSPSADPQAFVAAWDDTQGETTADEANDLIDLGRSICAKFDEGATAEDMMTALLDSDMSQDEASTVLAAAVSYLCPEHKSKVSD